MSAAEALGRLAVLAGIEPGYWDIFGQYHLTGDETKRALLRAMGIAASTDGEVLGSLDALEDQPWRETLPPVHVTRGTDVPVVLPVEASGDKLSWSLTLESGKRRRGAFVPSDLEFLEGRGVKERRKLVLPADLPEGYHSLTIGKAVCTFIKAPLSAYKPEWQAKGRRLWGMVGHLYSWRSDKDWGIGDFTTLAETAKEMAPLGADFLGINPLHALFPDEPEHASPYSPSNRRFLNPLYLDITAVPEFDGGFDGKGLGKTDHVDYTAVAKRKGDAFEALFKRFQALPKTHPRKEAFAAFVKEMGGSLRLFSTFFALREHFGGKHWHQWPEDFQCPKGKAATAFAEEHEDRLEFHGYLQFEADRQLGLAAKACADAGMEVGLYQDLAVGSTPDGSACWAGGNIHAEGVYFGAPPDAFNPNGQDWGLPPYNPLALREKAYAPFVAMLRANMRHAGALRIDHALGLMRLFWILPGEGEGRGAYVRYPFEDLLALISLESQRNKCLVIGEDLGTVPDGFRDRMAEENIFSYRLFYFERWKSGLYRRPDAYPAQSLATASTHDIFTIAGYWTGEDIQVRQSLGYCGPEALAERETERQVLLDALVDQELLARGQEPTLEELSEALHAFLARSPSALMGVGMDDLALEKKQLNFPGTVSEYPNWRRRISQTVGEIAGSPLTGRIAKAVSRERRD